MPRRLLIVLSSYYGVVGEDLGDVAISTSSEESIRLRRFLISFVTLVDVMMGDGRSPAEINNEKQHISRARYHGTEPVQYPKEEEIEGKMLTTKRRFLSF